MYDFTEFTSLRSLHDKQMKSTKEARFLPYSSERSWFENMTEQDVCDKLRSAALDREQYELIRNEVSQLVGQ